MKPPSLAPAALIKPAGRLCSSDRGDTPRRRFVAAHTLLAGASAGLVWLMGSGCQLGRPTTEVVTLPKVTVIPAERITFPGANRAGPGKPGDCDCNSPGHWDGDTLYVFNSTGHPWRSAGPDLFQLGQDYRSCTYDNQVNGGRWIECTWKAEDGALYGWYHFEPGGICTDHHPNSPHLTAPRIGAVRSSDNGTSWQDLGVVLDAKPFLRCDTTNYYFAGGNGDFSIMLDHKKQFLYFFISTYAGDASEQGVAVARMPWTDRNAPVGKVRKWHHGQWNEPGLGGQATPVFQARVDWHRGDADAFWGPSIHWNTHLRQYVILLNRAIDSRWKQEGVYVSFNADLAAPDRWSAPCRFMDAPGDDRWYPQVFGIDKANRETDKLAGRQARLFVRGESRWLIQFAK